MTEKALYDDQTIIIKFFLNVDKDVQAKRIKDLKNSVKKDFYIAGMDKYQQKHYEDYEDHLKKLLEATDFPYAPWDII